MRLLPALAITSALIVDCATSTCLPAQPLDLPSMTMRMDAEDSGATFVAPKVRNPRAYTEDDYPRNPYLDAIEGISGLRALVGTNGKLSESYVVSSSGNTELDRKAIQLLRDRQYLPATLDGQPVAAWVRVNFNWKIPRSPKIVTPTTEVWTINNDKVDTRIGYPPESIALGEEGVVHLRMTVQRNGNYTKPEILESSGHPRLDEAAIKISTESARVVSSILRSVIDLGPKSPQRRVVLEEYEFRLPH